MSRGADIYIGLGQGGQITSAGMVAFANEIATKWTGDIRLRTFDWMDWLRIVADVNARANLDRVRLFYAYSMSANAWTWVLNGIFYHGRVYPGIKNTRFDYGVFLDPTWLSLLSPICHKTLSAFRHYQNHSLDPWGHAVLTAAYDWPQGSDGKPIGWDVVATEDEHLRLDLRSDIQAFVRTKFQSFIAQEAIS